MIRSVMLAAWIVARVVEVPTVAGNRESVAPGIGERAERFLVAALRPLA